MLQPKILSNWVPSEKAYIYAKVQVSVGAFIPAGLLLGALSPDLILNLTLDLTTLRGSTKPSLGNGS